MQNKQDLFFCLGCKGSSREAFEVLRSEVEGVEPPEVAERNCRYLIVLALGTFWVNYPEYQTHN